MWYLLNTKKRSKFLIAILVWGFICAVFSNWFGAQYGVMIFLLSFSFNFLCFFNVLMVKLGEGLALLITPVFMRVFYFGVMCVIALGARLTGEVKDGEIITSEEDKF